MEKVSIKKNYIYNTLYQILTIIIPLVTAPYISRIFEADGVGVYSYTNAITMYFTMFAALGVLTYGQREIAQHRDDPKECSKLFWEIEFMCISTTLLSLIAWVILIIFSQNYSQYYTMLTMTVIATAFDISWFWSGQEQFKYVVLRNSIIKIIGVVLLFVFIKEKKDLLLYITLISVCNLLGNLSMWANLKKYLVKINWCELNVKRHYKQTLIYFIPTIATSIYTILDKAMIGWITHNEYQNGYYEQATKILNICKAIVLSVNTVVSSRISYMFSKKQHTEIKTIILTTMNFVFLLGCPAALGLIGIAKYFVPVFFGTGYDEVVNLLYLMSSLIVIIGLSNCLGALYFTPSGQRARSSKGIVAGAILNLLLNMFFIPLMGANGAALASVIAELTITIIYLYMARDYINISEIIKNIWKPILSAFIMLPLVIYVGSLFSSNIISIIVQIISGAIIYVVSLIVLKDNLLFIVLQKLHKKVISK